MWSFLVKVDDELLARTILPKPLHQINEPPAHDTIEIGNRTRLNGLDKRLALFVVQQGLPALRLSGLQTIGTVLIETLDPVADDLQADPA